MKLDSNVPTSTPCPHYFNEIWQKSRHWNIEENHPNKKNATKEEEEEEEEDEEEEEEEDVGKEEEERPN